MAFPDTYISPSESARYAAWRHTAMAWEALRAAKLACGSASG